ncbi:MAG TPA: aspartate carbamoyltransferase [Candidatus Methylomirabilis sp.]
MTRHLVSIDDLRNDEIEALFACADEMADLLAKREPCTLLAGRIMATLFFEPSTRTRLSFEAAMHRLGGGVISVPDAASSSAAKGESLADTARVISQYADVIVMRHPADGAARVLANYADVPVINAGDGSHEHPTQTLLDLYTLRKEKGTIKGLTVALCGDLRHGRTIHSLAAALVRFGAELIFLPGRDLEMPDHLSRRLALRHGCRLRRARVSGVQFLVDRLDALYLTPSQPSDEFAFSEEATLREFGERLEKIDALYVTRVQRERLGGGSAGDAPYPVKTDAALSDPRYRETIVMHPLPRVDELPYALDADPRSKYFKQAAYGVPIRMALLLALLEARRIFPAAPVLHPAEPGPPAAPGGPAGAVLVSGRDGATPPCPNGRCVTRREALYLPPAFRLLARERGAASHALILSCVYCDAEVAGAAVGHTGRRRYARYDAPLEESAERWAADGTLAVFAAEADAEAAGYRPFAPGPARTVLGADDVAQAIGDMARGIAQAHPDLSRVCFLGIRTRGVTLARRVAALLGAGGGMAIPVGALDVYEFRDDTTALDPGAPGGTDVPFGLEAQQVVLFDDVFYRGRTVRAAMHAITHGLGLGRPESVRVAVLVDRGHREFPIEPTFVGRAIPTSRRERVFVRLREDDGSEEVVVQAPIADE